MTTTNPPETTPPRTATAGTAVIRIPVSLAVTHVGMTLPHANDSGAAPPRAGRRLTGHTAKPPGEAGRPVVLAYCWIKLEDSRGHGIVISDLRLMTNGREQFINYPSEVRKLSCRQCSGKNVPRAKFCNWCGLAVDAGPIEYHDTVRPNNDRTAAMILEAVQKEYAARIGSAARDENPVSV